MSHLWTQILAEPSKFFGVTDASRLTQWSSGDPKNYVYFGQEMDFRNVPKRLKTSDFYYVVTELTRSK